MGFDAASWSAIGTGVGAIVSLGAAVFAGLQAHRAREALRIARDQAEAAKDQARSSREAAAAATTAKDAAVDQARSARESVEIAQATLHRADRPRFSIESEPVRKGQCLVTVTMLDGPPGLQVSVRWIAESHWPVGEGVEQTGITAGVGLGRYDLFRGADFHLGIDVAPEAEHGEIKLIMECTEMAADGRAWDHVEVIRWSLLAPNVW